MLQRRASHLRTEASRVNYMAVQGTHVGQLMTAMFGNAIEVSGNQRLGILGDKVVTWAEANEGSEVDRQSRVRIRTSTHKSALARAMLNGLHRLIGITLISSKVVAEVEVEVDVVADKSVKWRKLDQTHN